MIMVIVVVGPVVGFLVVVVVGMGISIPVPHVLVVVDLVVVLGLRLLLRLSHHGWLLWQLLLLLLHLLGRSCWGRWWGPLPYITSIVEHLQQSMSALL